MKLKLFKAAGVLFGQLVALHFKWKNQILVSKHQTAEGQMSHFCVRLHFVSDQNLLFQMPFC